MNDDNRSPSRWIESPVGFALPFASGIAMGVSLRLIFSDEQGGPLSAMSNAFVIGVPLIVGALTVLIAEQVKPRSWRYYVGAGAASVLLFVLGTMMLHLEGLICAVLIAPLFALLGAIGGLIMGAAVRLGKHAWRAMQAVALLPVAILLFETDVALPTQIHAITRSTIVDAAPDVVWAHLFDVEKIEASEVDDAWAFRIGVPTPKSAIMDPFGVPERRVVMGKGIYFDQLEAESVANHRLVWTYRFYRDSFPAGAMDDHVRIGGRYFDLLDTEYSLRPEHGQTRLEVRVRYRLSTRFNWYAAPILKWLLGDAADAYLNLYRTRAEGVHT